jgi:mono/diheme cytochrome c family protein
MKRSCLPRTLGREGLILSLGLVVALGALGAAAAGAAGAATAGTGSDLADPATVQASGARPATQQAGSGKHPAATPSSATDPVAGPTGSAAAVQAGRKLFLRHCADCHGEDARSGRRAPPLDSERVRQTPDEDLLWFLTNGNLRTGMPAWSRLPAARRWQILAYLRSLPAPPGRPAADDH